LTERSVVDTDVVSFFLKRDTRAELYRPHLHGKSLIVSFMTVAELDRWALQANWGSRRLEQMENYLSQFAISPFHRDLCYQWAEVTVAARRNGNPMGVGDAWIAATAVFLRVPLITHNRSHYAGVVNLDLISEAP
jgi:tRNA(fMet)-specific endonuclease VapC